MVQAELQQSTEATNQPLLNRPFTLAKGTTIKNRLFKSAMSEQLGDAQHNPKQGLVTLYRRWAEGGIGLAMTRNIMIDRNALGEPKNVVLDDKSDLTVFRKWAEAGKQNGSHIWPQLNHPGKQIPNFLTKEPVAPSAIPLSRGLEKGFNTPKALTEEEILTIIAKFATSAKLAKETGFTGVQIHGAHGYLVSQFLSPRHNQRDDQWGGTLENRMRFVLSVYHAIREQVGDHFPIGIKLNSADFMKGGFTEEDSMQVVQSLAEAGIDLIEISGGTYESPSMMSGKKAKESTIQREAYFLDYMEKVREMVDVPLVVTGGFRSAPAMNEALESGATDFIGLARTTAIDAEFPNKLIANAQYSMPLATPTTGSKAMDRLGMLSITWYEQQMWRMAKGLDPKPKLNAWGVVFKTLASAGIYAFRKRRA
ncbi:NADH:flavin oxidoreductase/NADH oxidase family protein [Photobacterium sp. DA100]|uniref:NADH:flavin oxidoreductase/NADH oxidase family protein n=1 Tax=Photobacterium sp. DA100 TaxID=3027472 RepID=UPI00247B1A16|nr:NADH:flavin oxidoreductase/NADH oxidase family protein [Photobacterium sp. DA100]WEM43694.1 NADH:flavin oxidoreductase/NADH oxidase family protein [Photobacterium sp. DA100]